MKRDKFRQLTAFTMRLLESMVTQTPGSTALKSSITSASPLSLKAEFSAYMPVCRQISRPLTRSDCLKDAWNSHMKVHSQISCGLTPMTLIAGHFLQEEQAGCLDPV